MMDTLSSNISMTQKTLHHCLVIQFIGFIPIRMTICGLPAEQKEWQSTITPKIVLTGYLNTKLLRKTNMAARFGVSVVIKKAEFISLVVEPVIAFQSKPILSKI